MMSQTLFSNRHLKNHKGVVHRDFSVAVHVARKGLDFGKLNLSHRVLKGEQCVGHGDLSVLVNVSAEIHMNGAEAFGHILSVLGFKFQNRRARLYADEFGKGVFS